MSFLHAKQVSFNTIIYIIVTINYEVESYGLWYFMPKAESYNPGKFDLSEKLEHMLQLGNCIKQLHKMGLAHRDIKPKNLLILNGRLCLSDFGLIWCTNEEDEHITEVNDGMGPQAIRPPELRSIAEVEGVDYRKSDVYLFAKTIWMVLKCNNHGFLGEYVRGKSGIYIDKKSLNIVTAEPLHRLMESATKDDWNERIDIRDCL